MNDLWDMELDKKVERTRSRPLASGALLPMQAVGECVGGDQALHKNGTEMGRNGQWHDLHLVW